MDLGIPQGALAEGEGVVGVVEEGDREAEGDAVLKRHDVLRFARGMMAGDLGARADADRGDIVGGEAVLVAQRAHRFDGGVGRDVAGVALDAEFAGLPAFAEARGGGCRTRRRGRGGGA